MFEYIKYILVGTVIILLLIVGLLYYRADKLSAEVAEQSQLINTYKSTVEDLTKERELWNEVLTENEEQKQRIQELSSKRREKVRTIIKYNECANTTVPGDVLDSLRRGSSNN